MMNKIALVALTIILLSFYFFPFSPRAIPVINTKMLLGGIGLFVICIALAKNRDAVIDRNFFFLSVIAGIISLIGLFSVYYNNTNDYTYVSYIISMWVWLSAAYVVVSFMRWVHGSASIFLLCNYLIGVCVAQCILALLMDFFEPIGNFVYSIIDEVTADFMNEKDRLSGLGAGLDVAGTRFSAVLVIIAFMCAKYQLINSKYLYFYIAAFLIISIVGNMISRTTSIGMIIGILYFAFSAKLSIFNSLAKRFWMSLLLMVVLFTPIVIYAYLNIPEFYQNLRFGFEGFFSLWEKGRWEVTSNDVLKNMYVFPETAKTWLIGDGYFNNPVGIDPYYTGEVWKGFYMSTDVGYLRFIFYFGILGLLAFIYFMYRVAKTCVTKFPTYKVLFGLLLVINFIFWLKVSTDIFVVFAPFLCISQEENDAYMERIALQEKSE